MRPRTTTTESIAELDALAALARWLRCPRCEGDVRSLGRLLLGCDNGHRFDVNKRGYLTVSPPRGIDGDPRGLLERRAAFLDTGHFSPIADAIARAVPDAKIDVLDSGCGTGWYLERLSAAGRVATALALDASPTAVTMAMRSTSASGLVTDVWSPLPVRSAAADLILCVFAPRNAAEFRRVIRPHGRLVVVTPAPEHLRELQDAGAVLSVPAGKAKELAERFDGRFVQTASERIQESMYLDVETATLLAGMGPSGYHDRLEPPKASHATLSVDVTTWSPITS